MPCSLYHFKFLLYHWFILPPVVQLSTLLLLYYHTWMDFPACSPLLHTFQGSFLIQCKTLRRNHSWNTQCLKERLSCKTDEIHLINVVRVIFLWVSPHLVGSGTLAEQSAVLFFIIRTFLTVQYHHPWASGQGWPVLAEMLIRLYG